MESKERISRASEKSSTRRRYRVCIIGAGMAGLSAAEALGLTSARIGDDTDVEVTVLEAMDRAGGRARTLPFAGDVVEDGAQFIHGCEGNPVYHRAVKHGLSILDHDRPVNKPLITPLPNGKSVPKSIVTEVSQVYDTICLKTQAGVYRKERERCGDKTVGAFVTRHFQKYYQLTAGNPKEKRIKANMFKLRVINECCYSASNSLDDLMLQDFGEYQELIGNVMLTNGYAAFIDTFLKNLGPGSVVYSKPVELVDWTCQPTEHNETDPIVITCQDGDQYKADYVIVTASLGYLKEHASTMFRPALPSRKLSLVSRMGFGNVAKIWFEYEKPFWSERWGGLLPVWDEEPADATRDTFTQEYWYRQIVSVTRPCSSPNVLLVWIYGKAATYTETLSEEEIAETVTDILKGFLNNPNIPLPTNVLRSQWDSNPFVRGSYSYVAAGSSGTDIDSLAEPVYLLGENGFTRPLICFAGEATHRTFYSTTHGAMLSGQREAKRIIADICHRNELHSRKKVPMAIGQDMASNVKALHIE